MEPAGAAATFATVRPEACGLQPQTPPTQRGPAAASTAALTQTER